MKYTSNKIYFGQVDSISFMTKQKHYSQSQNTTVRFELLIVETIFWADTIQFQDNLTFRGTSPWPSSACYLLLTVSCLACSSALTTEITCSSKMSSPSQPRRPHSLKVQMFTTNYGQEQNPRLSTWVFTKWLFAQNLWKNSLYLGLTNICHANIHFH
jgi:hypothetical protein